MALKYRILLLCALLLSSVSQATARTGVVLAWEPNPPQDNVAGYILYCGTTSRHDPNFRGYEVEVDVGNVVEYTLAVPDSATAYYFSFLAYDAAGLRSELSDEMVAYSIHANPLGNGVVTPGGRVIVEKGKAKMFTIAPSEGHNIDDVLADGVSVGRVSTYEFRGVSAAHTLSATFAINTYTVSLTAGAHGTTSPNGAVTVAHGDDLTFAVTPDADYQVWDVAVDGSSVGAVDSYTLQDIGKDFSVYATFAKETRTIRVSNGKGGTIRKKPKDGTASRTIQLVAIPSDVVVEKGASVAFEILPDPGYLVADVQVDNVSVGAVDTYEFTNVVSNHSISATFELGDTDGDQMPDDWERRYFGDLAAADSDDFDGDGISNHAEYVNGSDPTVPDLDPSLTPAVARPVSGGTVVSRKPELAVHNPIHEGGQELTYEFEVAADDAMSEIVSTASAIPEGVGVTSWVPYPALSDKTRYYWRARATTGLVSSEWTPICTFYVDTGGTQTTSEVEDAYLVDATRGITIEIDDLGKATHGVVVDLVPDTLPRDFLLTIGAVKNPPPAAGKKRLVGKVFEFGPHGTPFSEPVTLLLPYTEQNLEEAGVTDPSELSVLTFDTEALEWVQVPVEGVDDLGNRLVCKVEHFSMFGIGVAEGEPDAGSSSGGGGGGGGGGCFLQTLW